MVIMYLSVTNYLVNSYTVFSASALAANTILRSLFGFAFPLFAAPMNHNLGIHWASNIPTFFSIGVSPVSVRAVQVRRCDSEEMQVCGGSGEAKDVGAERRISHDVATLIKAWTRLEWLRSLDALRRPRKPFSHVARPSPCRS